MASVNKVILLGNLGSRPELRYTAGGTPVATLSVATNRRFKKNDEWHEQVEWHRVTVYGNRGKACGDHLDKGRQVYVEGRLSTRSYDDKEGNKRWVTDIVASDVQFLGKGNGTGSAPPEDETPPASDNDDPIPF